MSDGLLPKFLFELLKSVARLCLRRGVKIQQAEEALKRAFVWVAERELAAAAQSVSVSRVSLMTGLHRRDIPRFLDPETEHDEKDAGILTRVIGQWRSDKRFRTDSGRPRALTYEGTESDFFELVRAVNREFNPYTVLFELERLGAVRKEEKHLHLRAEVFNPSGDQAEGLRLLSGDVNDLVDAVGENIFSPGESPNLHIKTEYDNVCIDALPEIREWFLEKGGNFHEAARNHLSKFDKDLNPKLFKKEGGARIALGTFSIVQLPGKKSDE